MGATGATEFGPSLAAIPCFAEGECEAQQGAGCAQYLTVESVADLGFLALPTLLHMTGPLLGFEHRPVIFQLKLVPPGGRGTSLGSFWKAGFSTVPWACQAVNVCGLWSSGDAPVPSEAGLLGHCESRDLKLHALG